MRYITIDTAQESEITQLWQLALSGDRSSFQKLLEVTYDLMFQYGHKFTQDRELIKDGIQDVFLEILEKRDTLSRNIPPKPYLLASLRRRLHRLSQRQKWLLPGEPVTDAVSFDTEFSAEHHLIQSESTRNIAEQMAALMQALPKRQKEVLYLRFFQELDRDEIAYMMNIRPQSVSNLLQEAFKWLKIHWRPVISLLPFLFRG
jgi:RNA polymerase sigma factor (sigma-70 family)